MAPGARKRVALLESAAQRGAFALGGSSRGSRIRRAAPVRRHLHQALCVRPGARRRPLPPGSGPPSSSGPRPAASLIKNASAQSPTRVVNARKRKASMTAEPSTRIASCVNPSTAPCRLTAMSPQPRTDYEEGRDRAMENGIATGTSFLARRCWFQLPCSPSAPTYTKDVAPILYEHCRAVPPAQRSGADVADVDYDEVRPWARSIKTEGPQEPRDAAVGVGKSIAEIHQRSTNCPTRNLRRIVVVGRCRRARSGKRRRSCPAAPVYPGGWKFNREPDVVVKMPVDFLDRAEE